MADILITGATGFVGSHLVEALDRCPLRARALVRRTSDVTLLERHGVERVIGDISDPESLRRAVEGVQTVAHLAAATRALDADTFRRVNADGTRRLLDAMEAAGTARRLVYLSSMAAVGPARDGPVGPGDEPRPVSVYGQSKLEGERVAVERAGVAVAVLRAPAVYGPRDRDLLTFFRMAQWGFLPVAGRPDRRVQLVYARDLAESIVAAVEAPGATGAFHIAEPTAYTWAEVLGLVAAAVGRRGVRVALSPSIVRAAAAVTEAVSHITRRPAIFDRDKATELLAEWTCETEAARRELGFEATTALAEGLERTAGWYRANGWL